MIGLINSNTINIPLADESVHCVVTSPPYWGLRKYEGAHFACVDQDTECLTVSGWKKYNELSVGELMASYNLMDSALEWMPLESLHKYDVVNQEMVRLKGRNINQLLTPNHRCLIERREGHKVMVRADELKPSQKILVASDWNEASTQFPKRLARIIGWYVTEGHAGADCVHIYQSVSANPEYCKEIEQLLKDEGADYKQYTRTRDYNGEPRVSTSWRIVGSLANILLAICPNRTLPKGFLNWNIETLEMLWDALMKGDGHFRENGRQTFVQKNKVLIDQVQALATRLGFATTLRKRSLGTWALYKTVSKKRWLRSETTNIISMDIYTGVVWCPQNRNTTFVARRNGSVFITGNTYPPDLVEPCIKAGTSERGCCPCCGSPWERIVEKVFVATSEGRSNITGQDFMQGWEGVPRGSNKVTTVGWQPTCDCWFECQKTEEIDHWKENCWACDNPGVPDPVPCTVLDPFLGSGTTLQVARALGRDSVGLDIATEYIQLARRRLEIDKLAAWCDGKKETVKDSNVTELQMFEGLEEDHGHETV